MTKLCGFLTYECALRKPNKKNSAGIKLHDLGGPLWLNLSEDMGYDDFEDHCAFWLTRIQVRLKETKQEKF